MFGNYQMNSIGIEADGNGIAHAVLIYNYLLDVLEYALLPFTKRCFVICEGSFHVA